MEDRRCSPALHFQNVSPLVADDYPHHRFVALLRTEGFREALEILRVHTNDSTARAIYIRDEKKRDGKSDGQNQQEERASYGRIVTYQEIAEDSDQD